MNTSSSLPSASLSRFQSSSHLALKLKEELGLNNAVVIDFELIDAAYTRASATRSFFRMQISSLSRLCSYLSRYHSVARSRTICAYESGFVSIATFGERAFSAIVRPQKVEG